MNSPLIHSRGTLRPMFTLALPVLAEQTLNMLVGIVDTWLAGNFLRAPEYVAAMGLMAYTLWTLPGLFATVAISSTALVARFTGAGDRELAARTMNQALLMGAGFGVAVTLAVWLGGGTYVDIMQLEGEAGALAKSYLAILVPIVPCIMLEQVGIACLRGAGDTRSGLFAMGMVNCVNMTVSYLLCTGTGGLPAMGWRGLAIGTAVGHGVGAAIVLALLLYGRAGLKLSRARLIPDRSLLARLWRVGLPGGCDTLVVQSCHLWYLSVINGLGTVAAAAHTLGVRIESLAYLPGTAFMVAATTLAGQYLGAGQPRQAMKSVLVTGATCVLVMSAAGAVFYTYGYWMSEFFLGGSNPATGELSTRMLRVVALAMPSLAITMVGAGALRGAGDTRWPLAITLIGFLGFRLPLAHFLALPSFELPLVGATIAGLGLGVLGAWYAMAIDIVLRSLLVTGRLLQGGWRKTVI